MRFKRENKGFSLVELIVVIAIFSVVGVVVGGFLMAASRSYSVSANELDIQEEAQLVANQLQEMILDTALGISYQYVVTDDTGAELIDYMENDAIVLPEGDLTKKDLYIYSKDNYYHIFWDKEKAELYLIEYVNDGSGYVPAEGMPTTGVLFGEFISDFSVDLSQVASKRMVSFDITFKKNGSDRDYLVTRTVSLRNDVMTNQPAEDVYNAVNLEFEPVADDISIDPSGGTFLWPGEAQPYKVTLTCSKGGVPSQDVSWSLASGDGIPLDANTKFTGSNLLQVSSNENSSKIEVHATARGYNYGTNSEIVLTEPTAIWIDVGQVRSLSIVENQFETTPVRVGGIYDVTVKMEGDNLSGKSVTDAGGIVAQVRIGNEYAEVVNTTIDGLQATFTFQVNASTPNGSEIALSFRAEKPEFADVYTNSAVYKVGGDEGAYFNISSGSGVEWLRLGKAITNLEFTSEELEEQYLTASGTLKSGYYILYTYKVYDSDYNLKRTAFTASGTGGPNAQCTEYFNGFWHLQGPLQSVAQMTDKVFLQSGTVVVKADLMFNNAGTSIVVGSSDNLTYFIPQASISFKRAEADDGLSNMKAYITEKANNVPIYISFPTGFASDTYTISLDNAKCDPATLGAVVSGASDISKNKVMVQGNSEAEYKASANNVFNFTYGGLTDAVSVILTSPNVTGTDYYVPMNTSEWTYTSTKIVGSTSTDNYVYYIDDTHRMVIEWQNNACKNATFYKMENLNWVKVGNYTMNKTNKTWDLSIS